MRKNINVIACIDENYALGKNNELIYNIPADLIRFKHMTTDNVVIMGWNTHQSLPKKKLPNRINIVITNREVENPVEGVIYKSSLNIAIRDAADFYPDKKIFIIGGATIYAEAMADLIPGDRVYLTKVHNTRPADVYFPEYDVKDFFVCEGKELKDEKMNLSYQFVTMVKAHKIFLSMPFTGYENQIVERYQRMVDYVAQNLPGYIPVTQDNIMTIAQTGFSLTGNDYNRKMLKDFELIESCDAVLFADGWERSRGCYVEWTVAKLFKKELIYLNTQKYETKLHQAGNIGEDAVPGI